MTNQLKAPPAKLISRYAKRMIIENSIQDGIDFFHMDALPSAVAMKVNLDLQLTLMGSSLYHLLGQDVGRGYEVAKSRHIFRDLVDTPSVLILDLIQNEAYIESRSAFSCGGFKMTQITLRGLDALAEDQIRKRARETGKSLNQVVLDIVHQALGVGGQQKRPAGEELRFLAGGWTQAEAEEVMAGVVQCRQIDEELWT
ncbi:MAG: hypothetical protein U5L00_14735 [Desulfovermiculus sp.]|nr:hypothetical protein [Desulfovermiculus sp.]